MREPRAERSTASARPELPPALRQVVEHGTGGQSSPLEPGTRRAMEGRFEHDFRAVRVFDDARANEAALALGADAFAVGSDLVFASGAYSPSSPGGERLLRHELTHVVQGASAAPTKPLSHPGDASERQADAVADGAGLSGGQAASAAVSRHVLNGKDVENDFWGTKEMLGERWGGTVDAGMSTFWDIAGLHPIGTGVSTGIDLAKAGTSAVFGGILGSAGAMEDILSGDAFNGGQGELSKMGDSYLKGSRRFAHDAAWDAAGFIPGFGKAQGVLSAVNDGRVTLERAAGLDPKNEDPLASDYFYKGASSLENWIFN